MEKIKWPPSARIRNREPAAMGQKNSGAATQCTRGTSTIENGVKTPFRSRPSFALLRRLYKSRACSKMRFAKFRDGGIGRADKIDWSLQSAITRITDARSYGKRAFTGDKAVRPRFHAQELVAHFINGLAPRSRMGGHPYQLSLGSPGVLQHRRGTHHGANVRDLSRPATSRDSASFTGGRGSDAYLWHPHFEPEQHLAQLAQSSSPP